MRYFTLLHCVVSLTFCSTLSAQIAKGGKLQFGTGNIGLVTIGTPGSPENNQTSLETTLGYGALFLISDRFAVGGGIGTFASGRLNDGAGALIPSARYYFNPDGPALHWFATTGLGFDLQLGSDTRLSFDEWILGGGVDIFLNDHVILETGANLTFLNDRINFLRAPRYSLATGLLVYLSTEDRADRKSTVPAIARGRWLIGINALELSYRPRDDDFFFTAALQPNVGYFVSDRWLAGLGLRLLYNDFRFNTDFPDLTSDIRTLSAGLNLFTRYYPGDLNRRLRPFAHIEGGIVLARSRYQQAGQAEIVGDNSWLSGRFGLGANLFLAPTVALEGTLTYATDRNQGFTAETFFNRSFGIDLGFQFFLK